MADRDEGGKRRRLVRRSLWGFLPLAIVVALIAVFATRFGHDPRYIPSPLVHKPAPQFALPSLFEPGRQIDNGTLKGHVVLLNFFASWCLACTDESPSLDYLHRQGVVIYGLDFDDTRPAAKQWLDKWGNPYKAVAFDHDGEEAANWGIWGVPETFVIDRQGRIVHKFTGIITRQIADRQVIPLVRRLERKP